MTSDLPFTGERYVPGALDPDLEYTHEHRYRSILDLVRGKSVVDFGSGAGYGSALLASTAESVVGFDVSEDAIKHATATWSKGNLTFTSSLKEITSLENRVDVVVSFEMIEHVEDGSKAIFLMKSLLRSNGMLILSTPNKSVYQDQLQRNNPFHLHEYYFEELADLLKSSFTFVDVYGQHFLATSIIFPFKRTEQVAQVCTLGHDNPTDPIGFFAVCSDEIIDFTPTGALLPDAFQKSNDLLGGLPASRLQDLLDAMDEERRTAQEHIWAQDAIIERLNQQLRSIGNPAYGDTGGAEEGESRGSSQKYRLASIRRILLNAQHACKRVFK